MRLTVGAPAPAFQLESAKGPVLLAALRGSRVVLYFYPKDDTHGCTREACGFRDSMKRLDGHGVTFCRSVLRFEQRSGRQYVQRRLFGDEGIARNGVFLLRSGHCSAHSISGMESFERVHALERMLSVEPPEYRIAISWAQWYQTTVYRRSAKAVAPVIGRLTRRKPAYTAGVQS